MTLTHTYRTRFDVADEEKEDKEIYIYEQQIKRFSQIHKKMVKYVVKIYDRQHNFFSPFYTAFSRHII